MIVRALIDPKLDTTSSDHHAKQSIYVDEIRLNSINDIFNTSSKQIVSSSEGGTYSVYAADIDGDGDMDVLSASRSGDTVAWFENDGKSSNPTFTKRIIGTANGALSVCAADIDGDGDIDVLSANIDENTIILWENGGKSNNFVFTKRVITNTVNWPTAVYVADIDGDGDIDVLSASFNDHTIAWYENGGQSSNPTFTKRVIANSVSHPHTVYAVDIDLDGDMDVLSASVSGDTVSWFENNGQSNNFAFTKRTFTSTVNGPFSVYAIDIDNDGDMDVVSANIDENTIIWWENGGQSSNYAFTKRVITNTANRPASVYAVDLDGDGDMDVLSASHLDKTIAWYENGGQSSNPTFTKRVITTTADGAISVYAVDLDGDGDMDVLSASETDNTIAWYQNYRLSFVNCPTGKYYSIINGSSACLNCTVGSYQNETGKSSCKSCPAGSYQDQVGQTFCTTCPIGTYHTLEGQASFTPCKYNSSTIYKHFLFI